jgi:ABC-2 type transport system ATP-binding protein
MPVQLKNIQKSFGKQQVLRGIDLELRQGAICGLLGPSGCGKTTLVNIITGMSRANAGEALVLGEKTPFAKVKNQIGFMPQSEALYLDLTAAENLRFFGSLYGLSAKEMDSEIPRVLDIVRLDAPKRKLVAAFSGGMKRRLSLAVALLHKPRLLVLDEPTVGLDPEHRLSLWREFRTLADNGSCLLITTHVMDEAASCDTIVMLKEGKIIADGTPAELMQKTGAKNLEETFLRIEEGNL